MSRPAIVVAGREGRHAAGVLEVLAGADFTITRADSIERCLQLAATPGCDLAIIVAAALAEPVEEIAAAIRRLSAGAAVLVIGDPRSARDFGLDAADVLAQPIRADALLAAAERALRPRQLQPQRSLHDDPGDTPEATTSGRRSRSRSGRPVAPPASSPTRSDAAAWLDVADVILVALDDQHRVTTINRRGCEVLGCEQSDIVGRDWIATFIPSRQRARTLARFEQLMTGEAEHAEYLENTILTAAGEERLIAWHTALCRAADGAVIGTFSSGEDVTEQRRVEQALRASRTRLQLILDTAPVGIGEVHDRVFTWVSPVLCEMIGYRDDELLGNSARMVYASDEEYERVGRVKYGQIGILGSGQVDTQWRCRDGRLIDVDLRSSAVDPGDLTAGVIFTVLDISERRRAETALRDSEQRFRAIFEQAAVGVAQVETATGRFMRVNDRFCQITGFRPDEITAQTFMAITHPDDLEAELENMRRLVRGEVREFSMEHRCLRPDGALVWVDLAVSPMWLPGDEATFHIAVVQDITTHKLLEDELRQAQKLEAVGRLAGGIAHDFNNILQAIVMQVELAKARLGDRDPVHRLLEGIHDGADRAADLTRQLLAFSRRQVLRPREVDLNQLITHALVMIRRIIGEDIDVAFSPTPDLPLVSVDPVQLEQVLMNLCVNARDAMPAGGLISIATVATVLDSEQARSLELKAPGPYVGLVVADSGTGIERPTRERMFEPFFTTKSPGAGTGLGLATVYGIVRQHGGGIEVESETGCGSTFTIYLAASGTDATITPETPIAPPPIGGSETILLAEDEPAVRNLMRVLLEEAGYTVLEAEDGEEAIALFRSDPAAVDLAVLDVVMPHLGGKEVYDRIARIRSDLPVVFASGYSGNVIHTRFVVPDDVNLIQKPFSAAELLSLVRRVLDDRELLHDGGDGGH